MEIPCRSFVFVTSVVVSKVEMPMSQPKFVHLPSKNLKIIAKKQNRSPFAVSIDFHIQVYF